MTPGPVHPRPSLRRLAAELAALVRPSPFPVFAPGVLDALPRGDGGAVLVLPGATRGDGYTAGMRAFLAGLGHRPYGWGLGPNLGPTARLIRGAQARLAGLHAAHGPVSLVGYSMGGLFVRLLAARHPALVRQIVTVCSPFDRPAASLALPLEPVLGLWRGPDLRALSDEVARPPPVPATAIYSRDDGLVRWAHCRAGNAGDIAVSGCHVTMASNPQALLAIAERLARPPGA